VADEAAGVERGPAGGEGDVDVDAAVEQIEEAADALAVGMISSIAPMYSSQWLMASPSGPDRTPPWITPLMKRARPGSAAPPQRLERGQLALQPLGQHMKSHTANTWAPMKQRPPGRRPRHTWVVELLARRFERGAQLAEGWVDRRDRRCRRRPPRRLHWPGRRR
jgi:hypothetical protein